MSRHIKRMGYDSRFLNITEHVRCRMYSGYKNAVEGIGKNIFDFLGKNTLVLFLMAIAIFFFLFFPFPLLVGCAINKSPWIWHILFANILYSLTWLFMFLGQRLKWWYGLLWPLMFLNLLYLAGWSWFRSVSGKGFVWKDRKVE
jgi:chlorobactene glucosyltransferase